MKLIARTLAVCTVIAFSPSAFSTDASETRAESHYTIETARVEEVLQAKDGKFKNISYVVVWNGSRVGVEDPLARSNHRPGEAIKFMAQRVRLRDSPNVSTLHFLLVEPESK